MKDVLDVFKVIVFVEIREGVETCLLILEAAALGSYLYYAHGGDQDYFEVVRMSHYDSAKLLLYKFEVYLNVYNFVRILPSLVLFYLTSFSQTWQ